MRVAAQAVGGAARHIDGGGFWTAGDRLRACRLLGRQPTQAPTDRRIAEVFAASYAVRPAGKPFSNLRSDMGEVTRENFVETIKERFPDLVEPVEKARARQILIGLADENIEFLEELLAEHKQDDRTTAEQDLDRIEFDHSARGAAMRQHHARMLGLLFRGMGAYKKWQGRQTGRRAEDGGRRKDGGREAEVRMGRGRILD